MQINDFQNDKKHFRNFSIPQLMEAAICRGEGYLSKDGALIVNTGKYTGRSPNDKFTVYDETTKDTVWWNKNNKEMTPEHGEALFERIAKHLSEEPRFILDCRAGASEVHQQSIRVITERAWHSLFAHNMFIEQSNGARTFKPDFTVYHAPSFLADPKRDHTNSEAAIVIDFAKKRICICGTEYAGEIKKSVFTVLNYLLPPKQVLGMHCSANKSSEGQVAIFFGLSGTGKTTLSADPSRILIGDDEHGWDDEGVFNFEGGCYAKVIRLSEKDEPEIFSATKSFGTILENVVFDEQTRNLNLDDPKFTENTRASYDISRIPHADPSKKGGHPEHIIMLTCDAFGVLPPIAKLTSAQATYHFLNGYTARVAGTERGVVEPTAVFSACFGAPFMARPPSVYAHLLAQKIAKHKVQCWLVNTGWTGGPHGVGSRMKISWTRAMLHAALSGALTDAEYVEHPVFQVAVPKAVLGVPAEVLDAKSSWKNKAAYDQQAKELAALFAKNFEPLKNEVSKEVQDAAPRIAT